jgi:hypothetical protein
VHSSYVFIPPPRDIREGLIPAPPPPPPCFDVFRIIEINWLSFFLILLCHCFFDFQLLRLNYKHPQLLLLLLLYI